MICTILSKIKFKKDEGVYVNFYTGDYYPTHILPLSKKETDHKATTYSEIFLSEGRESVERHLITQIIKKDILLKGQDPSIKKYRDAITFPEFAELNALYCKCTDKDAFFDTEDALNLLNIIIKKIHKRLQ